MLNKRKIYALLLCLVGVLLTNLGRFLELEGFFYLYAPMLGLSFSFAGLALYLSGIKNRVEKKIRVCPNCFYKNDASLMICAKCKTPLL